MIRQLTAMLGTPDLSEWESGFVESVAFKTKDGTDTSGLSEKQIQTLTTLYGKHFGDAS